MFLGTETRTSVRSTYLARTQGESIEARIQTKGKLRKYLELVPSHEKFTGCFFTCKKNTRPSSLPIFGSFVKLPEAHAPFDTWRTGWRHPWPTPGGPTPLALLRWETTPIHGFRTSLSPKKWPKMTKITEHVVNRPFSDRLKSGHISSMANKHGSLPRHSSLALFGVMRKPVPSSFPTQSRSRKAPWR